MPFVAPQMGRQLHGVLLNHMQRYTYSAMGALRWKRDMTAYGEWVRSLHAPLVDEKFEELQVKGSLPSTPCSHEANTADIPCCATAMYKLPRCCAGLHIPPPTSQVTCILGSADRARY